MTRRYYFQGFFTTPFCPLDERGSFVYCVHNRAVGETFRSVVCWGEDSEPHKNRREAPKADAPVRFLRENSPRRPGWSAGNPEDENPGRMDTKDQKAIASVWRLGGLTRRELAG